MIEEYTKANLHKILYVINDAALKYKGVIPNDCFKNPYMSEKELLNEFSNNVRMFGFKLNKNLIGVMGIHDRVNPQRIQRTMNALLPPSMQKE